METIMIKVNTIENYNQVNERYYVTTCGRIVSLFAGKVKVLKPNINKKGYHQYRLITEDGGCIRPYGHKLVALAYLSNDDDAKDQVDHLDMDKDNNAITNLEWVTGLENMRRRNKVLSNFTEEQVKYIRTTYYLKRVGKIWVSNAKELAEEFNVNPKTITSIVNRKTYTWVE